MFVFHSGVVAQSIDSIMVLLPKSLFLKSFECYSGFLCSIESI